MARLNVQSFNQLNALRPNHVATSGSLEDLNLNSVATLTTLLAKVMGESTVPETSSESVLSPSIVPSTVVSPVADPVSDPSLDPTYDGGRSPLPIPPLPMRLPRSSGSASNGRSASSNGNSTGGGGSSSGGLGRGGNHTGGGGRSSGGGVPRPLTQF